MQITLRGSSMPCFLQKEPETIVLNVEHLR